MGMRETLNKHPGVVTAVVSVIILVFGVLIWRQVKPGLPAGISDQDFYTDDDGASYYKDSTHQLSPYDHNGKQAVRCFVFQCGKDKFVGYMIRFTPDAIKTFQATIKEDKVPSQSEETVGKQNVEIKKPGGGSWLKLDGDADAVNKVFRVTCPDGSTKAQAVLP